jgi:kinesin family protein 2/24
MAKKGPGINLFFSLFEILGNVTTDLLNKDTIMKADIVEDKFGKVNVINVNEVQIESCEQLMTLVEEGMAHRKTATTFKNDTSSRSHAVCSIRVVNTVLKKVEDGKIFVIDLAGAENASDSQFHDKSRVQETRAINQALMSLKNCIRSRALSAVNLDQYHHVPYRMSKLTLLLKDAFEVESRRLSKTVVIANVSPSVADVAMSLNTLRYVTPLKIGQSNREKIVANPKNPANWDNSVLRKWVKCKGLKDILDPEILCPFESGLQILRLPEVEFVERVLKAAPGWGEKMAKAFYVSLWKLLIDARTADRKQKLKPKGGKTHVQRLKVTS